MSQISLYVWKSTFRTLLCCHQGTKCSVLKLYPWSPQGISREFASGQVGKIYFYYNSTIIDKIIRRRTTQGSFYANSTWLLKSLDHTAGLASLWLVVLPCNTHFLGPGMDERGLLQFSIVAHARMQAHIHIPDMTIHEASRKTNLRIAYAEMWAYCIWTKRLQKSHKVN